MKRTNKHVEIVSYVRGNEKTVCRCIFEDGAGREVVRIFGRYVLLANCEKSAYYDVFPIDY